MTLSYNDDGELTDRGTTEGAAAIMTLLTADWNYPVSSSDLDPGDPLVNTGTEYMFQMATIAYHVLDGTQQVTLAEDVEYNGELFAAGSYEVAVEGRYWTDFDRQHPLEGPAREQAWDGTVHGLVGELGVGTVTHSTLQMGLALAALFAGLGATVLLTGVGLVWAMKAKDKEIVEVTDVEITDVEIPDTVPDSLLQDQDLNATTGTVTVIVTESLERASGLAPKVTLVPVLSNGIPGSSRP